MTLRTRKRTERLAVCTAVLALAGLLACGAPPADTESSSSDEGEAAAPQESQAPASAPATVTVTVPAGTELIVSMSTPVSSGTSQVGDVIEATTLEPVVIGNRVPVPAGSTIRGEVIEVVPAKKGLDISEKGGALVLAFTGLTTADGYAVPLRASLAEKAKSGGKTGGIIGGSAAGGAVLGKILGDDDKDAVVGAVIGTGIGTAIAAGTKGKEMKIPEGTELLLVLEADVTIEME